MDDLDAQVGRRHRGRAGRRACGAACGRAVASFRDSGPFIAHILLGTGELVFQETVKILELASKQDNFIFNLGHGIQPETPVKNVRLLVDTVHSFKVQRGK